MGHERKKCLTIFVNDTCNLQCVYCYVGERSGVTERRDVNVTDVEDLMARGSLLPSGTRVIDLDFVKRGVLDFFEKYQSRHIRFFSIGEATIALDRLKEIRNWVYEITHGNCTFELQTNGFFSETTAHWVANNMNIVWISCDGFPAIQDRYRPTIFGSPSSGIVERNIKILASYPNLTLGCRATIGAENMFRQREMINYFGSLGVKAVMSDPMFLPVGDCKEGRSLSKENISLLSYAEKFLEARGYAAKLGMFYGSIFSVNFDEKVDVFCRSCVPYPHLTVDKFVTCCDMAYDGANPKMQLLIYGEYDPAKGEIKYDQEAIQRIQSRTAVNMPECQQCEVLHNCAGACVGEALNETGSMFGIKPEVCEAIRYLAKHMELNAGPYPYVHP